MRVSNSPKLSRFFYYIPMIVLLIIFLAMLLATVYILTRPKYENISFPNDLEISYPEYSKALPVKTGYFFKTPDNFDKFASDVLITTYTPPIDKTLIEEYFSGGEVYYKTENSFYAEWRKPRKNSIYNDSERALKFAIGELNKMGIYPKNYNARVIKIPLKLTTTVVEYMIFFYPAINGIPVFEKESHLAKEEEKYQIRLTFRDESVGIDDMRYNWIEVSLSENSAPPPGFEDYNEKNIYEELKTIFQDYYIKPIFMTDDFNNLKKYYELRENFAWGISHSTKYPIPGNIEYLANAETGETIECRGFN